MTKKVIKLIDPKTGLMVCKVCGNKHWRFYQKDVNTNEDPGNVKMDVNCNGKGSKSAPDALWVHNLLPLMLHLQP